MEPRILIASSKDGQLIAYSLQEALYIDPIEATVWTQDFSYIPQPDLREIIRELLSFHIGIFILTSDDIATIRSTECATARDNVIFELGLFVGALGQDRTYYLIPDSQKSFHLPSDLFGITAGFYNDERKDQNWTAALVPFANKIRKAYQKIKVPSLGELPLDSIQFSQSQSKEKAEEKDIPTHDFYHLYKQHFRPKYADYVAFTGTKPSQILLEEENILEHIIVANSTPDAYEQNMEKALVHLIRVTIDLQKLFWVSLKETIDQLMSDSKSGSSFLKKIKPKEKDGNYVEKYLESINLARAARHLEMSSSPPIKVIEATKIIEAYDQALNICFQLLKQDKF